MVLPLLGDIKYFFRQEQVSNMREISIYEASLDGASQRNSGSIIQVVLHEKQFMLLTERTR